MFSDFVFASKFKIARMQKIWPPAILSVCLIKFRVSYIPSFVFMHSVLSLFVRFLEFLFAQKDKVKSFTGIAVPIAKRANDVMTQTRLRQTNRIGVRFF